jgi:preprotein translocase SecE subunit
MNLEIYKKGQGKIARVTAYSLVGVLILFGAYRLFATFNVPGEGVLVAARIPVIGQITIMKIVAIVAFAVGLLLMHLVLNGPKLATLLIDTEQEMRKVSWPSKSEVKSATLVVVLVTFIMAFSLFGFDQGLQRLFSFVF